MKYILVLLLAFTFSNADIMKVKTMACPSVQIMKKAPLDTAESMDLNLFAIANGCVVVYKNDKVEAIGYDPLNTKTIYQKILYKRTGNVLYIKRATIQVEQAGKKGVVRF